MPSFSANEIRTFLPYLRNRQEMYLKHRGFLHSYNPFDFQQISDKFSMWSSYHPDMTTTKQKTKIRAYRYYKTDSITT